MEKKRIKRNTKNCMNCQYHEFKQVLEKDEDVVICSRDNQVIGYMDDASKFRCNGHLDEE